MIRGIFLAVLLALLPVFSGASAAPLWYHATSQARPLGPSSPPTEDAGAPLFAQDSPTYAQYGGRSRRGQAGGRQVIPPSAALGAARSRYPGSQGLGVSLSKGGRLMYSVKLKTGNRVHRVLVDARTGRVLGD